MTAPAAVKKQSAEQLTSLRLSGIVNDSIVDGPGLRLTVFAQGCFHNCEGCHNPNTHDPEGGYWAEIRDILIKVDKNPLLDGVTLSGGEPFLQAAVMAELAEEVASRGLSVWVYTGFTWEELLTREDFMPLVLQSDCVVDGRYNEALRSLSLQFKGSANQRIIDVRKSLKLGRVTEMSCDAC